MTDAGWVCKASSGNSYDINDPSGSVTLDFGTIEAGIYAIRYCGGAWQLFDNDDTIKMQWFVMLPAGSGDRSDHSIGYPQGYWVVNYSGGAASVDITGLYDLDDLISQADAEWHNQCGGAIFCHAGGHINLVWTTMPVISGGITAGTPLPTWSLYEVNPYVASSACADWLSPGNAECSFTIKNISHLALTGLTVTLNNAGGVSGASSPVTGVSIGAGGTANVYFTFNASTPNVTATLSIAGCGTNIISYNLSPLISLTSESGPTHDGQCANPSPPPTAIQQYKYTVNTRNDGSWKATPIDVTITATNGIKLVATGCVAADTVTLTGVNAGTCHGGASTAPPIFHVLQTLTVPIATTFTMVFKDHYSGAVLGTFTFNSTVPA